MSEDIDPFERLVVDENAPLDKKLVVEIIGPFVESIGKNKVIDYKKNFEKSPAWLKILIYLCCRKVMSDKKIVSEERVGPREISQDVGISEGSAKDISRDRNLRGLLLEEKGKYLIPNSKLKRVKSIVEGYGRSGT